MLHFLLNIMGRDLIDGVGVIIWGVTEIDEHMGLHVFNNGSETEHRYLDEVLEL